MSIQSVCVFCGAQNAVPKTYLDAGYATGELLARRGLKLVYGGGDCGLMGQTANAVMQNGGWVTGVFPEHLREFEQEHDGISKTIIVDSMHTRKEIMYQKSDAFIVLPGGFGTMDEMFEIITWRQLRLHDKPVIIFNHEGYWSHLIALMKNIIGNGFAHEEVHGFYQVVETLEEMDALLQKLQS